MSKSVTIKNIDSNDWEDFSRWCKICNTTPSKFLREMISQFKMNKNQKELSSMLLINNFLADKSNILKLDRLILENNPMYSFMDKFYKDNIRTAYCYSNTKKIIDFFNLK